MLMFAWIPSLTDREVEVKNAISGRNNQKVIPNEHLSALKEGVEERDLLAAELAANAEPNPEPTTTSDEEDLIVFHS